MGPESGNRPNAEELKGQETKDLIEERRLGEPINDAEQAAEAEILHLAAQIRTMEDLMDASDNKPQDYANAQRRIAALQDRIAELEEQYPHLAVDPSQTPEA